MKKSDLKRIIKPLVKECIQEGLLSNVVAEVAKGMQGNVLVEAAPVAPPKQDRTVADQTAKSRAKMQEQRASLMKSIGEDAYNGVNLFEGTDPIQTSQPAQGHADIGASNDAGVDISSLMANSSAIWQALK